MALQQKKTTAARPAAEEGLLNFLQDDFYVSGGGLPESDYVWVSLDIIMFAGFNTAKAGQPRLGCMITMKDLHDLTADPRKQFYSFGTKAHLSFAPSSTGKGIKAIPGGLVSNLNDMTNWAAFRQSIFDCEDALRTLLTNDVSILEGSWVHMQSVPEPEGRSGFGSNATGEVQEERRKGTIAVVTSFLDGGKPWEGTGGVPATSPFATPTAIKSKPLQAKPVNGLAAAPITLAPASSTDDDVRTAAVNGLAAVLESNPEGLSKLLARTNTLNHIKSTVGDDMATAVAAAYFGTDAAWNSVLGDHGYSVQGSFIRPAA